MNWKEISEKFPEAFKTFFKWYWADNRIAFDGDSLYFSQTIDDKSYAESSISFKDILRIRVFYDFFDENEIWINVVHRDFGNLISVKPFMWKINQEYSEGYSTRAEAETAAFTKAFEILENKLK